MSSLTQWAPTFQFLVELLATAAFALSGIMKAARRGLDAVGVCVVGFLTAFGGGTLRDVLLDQRPFFWIRHVEVLWGVLALCLMAMLFMRQSHFRLTEKAIQWPDALGLGLFTAAGVSQALALELTGVVAVIMGVVTAVFGGVLRDIVCNEIPAAFSDHRPYAVCAFAGAWAHVGLTALDAPGWMAMGVCMLVTVGMRAMAVWRDWQLPAWRP